MLRSTVKLIKKERDDEKKQLQEEMKKYADKEREFAIQKAEALKADIIEEHTISTEVDNQLKDEIGHLRLGVLSLQGKSFREECRHLLGKDVITMDEYEEFEDDYAAYKGLGGNHNGDALHDRVVDKFSKQSCI